MLREGPVDLRAELVAEPGIQELPHEGVLVELDDEADGLLTEVLMVISVKPACAPLSDVTRDLGELS